jgi:hypothetical protein
VTKFSRLFIYLLFYFHNTSRKNTGTNLALWLTYKNAKLDKKASVGLPNKPVRGRPAAPGAKQNGHDDDKGKGPTMEAEAEAVGSGDQQVKQGSVVLAFRLESPADLEDGHYTLGVIDPTTPDERTRHATFPF